MDRGGGIQPDRLTDLTHRRRVAAARGTWAAMNSRICRLLPVNAAVAMTVLPSGGCPIRAVGQRLGDDDTGMAGGMQTSVREQVV